MESVEEYMIIINYAVKLIVNYTAKLHDEWAKTWPNKVKECELDVGLFVVLEKNG